MEQSEWNVRLVAVAEGLLRWQYGGNKEVGRGDKGEILIPIKLYHGK